MQSYINHLIEDIANAHRAEQSYTAPAVEKDESMEAHFAEIERWIEHEPTHTFSYYCGLQKEQFPPAEKLTEEQMQQINKAFGQLLFTWNLDTAIPENVPTALTYTLLVSVLDEKMEPVTSGILTFEFCNYDSASCPFGHYCTCKDFEDDENMDIELPKGDLPF